MPGGNAATAVASAATGGGFDVLGGLISLGSGLLGGLTGLGQSPQQRDFQQLYDTVYSNMPWLKQLPFTKEELFNQILPTLQKTYAGAADVAAGRIGSTIGETSNAPLGQTFMDYYTQALAPVIAKGQEEGGNAYQNFIQMYSGMDQNAKSNFLKALSVAGQAASGASNMTDAQKFFTNFLQGSDLGSKIYGNIQYGTALRDKGNSLSNMWSQIMGGNG